MHDVETMDVLVVDDDREFLAGVLPALRAEHLTVDFAGDVVEARRLISRKRFSVVTVGLLLKSGSGFDVLQRISELESRPNVLVITAADPAMLGKIDRTVVKTVLFKPVNPSHVAAYIHTLSRT